MNRYASSIVDGFSSRENRAHLLGALMEHFNNEPNVKRFLDKNFDDLIAHFRHSIEQELYTSDPLPGTTVRDQLTCFNNQFIDDRVHLIKTHVTGDENVPLYSVEDGAPTSRNDVAHYQKNAKDILASWAGNSGRGIQTREDPSADAHPNNPYSSGRMSTGVVFCDQSGVGMQRHQDLFFGSAYMHALNKTIPGLEHERTPFGVSNPAADARLLARQSFRKNEAGTENAIPRYESRLYNRNIDRDVREGLRGGERGCVLLAHDMSSLHRRIEHKNNARAKFNTDDVRPQVNLQYSNGRIPDAARYG